MVDIERLTSGWLREQHELTNLIGNRVYTALPESKVWPLVRLTLIDQTPSFRRPLHLTDARLQFDVFGGPKIEAREVADTIIDLLANHFTGSHDLGVVTGVDIASLVYDPDEAQEPARPRYRFDAVVYVHPHAAIPAS